MKGEGFDLLIFGLLLIVLDINESSLWSLSNIYLLLRIFEIYYFF